MCFSRIWMWFMSAIAFLQGTYLWTPVLLASYGNQIDILKLLIQHSARLDIRNHVSIAVVLPIHYACL